MPMSETKERWMKADQQAWETEKLLTRQLAEFVSLESQLCREAGVSGDVEVELDESGTAFTVTVKDGNVSFESDGMVVDLLNTESDDEMDAVVACMGLPNRALKEADRQLMVRRCLSPWNN
ncbi:hypothetical protein [Kribbibacterium absianum]|nr:hypothetical protein [Olsenella sp. YH-ols2216]